MEREAQPVNYDQVILLALDGKIMYVRVPFYYQHRQEALRDRAVQEVRAKLKPLESAVFKLRKDSIQFRSGGRIVFVIDRREGGHWMEQDWARGVTWGGGLIAYWPEDVGAHNDLLAEKVR